MDYGSEMQRAYARELQYPCRESRIKEALWLGDLDLALERATAHCAITPTDARVWIQIGEVQVERDDLEGALTSYLTAARFSPPGGEIAKYMAGQCYEQLGAPDAALDSYLSSLRIDPLGVSSAEKAQQVAKELGSPIEAWAQGLLSQLRTGEYTQTTLNEIYQRLPNPVEKA